VKKSFLIIGLNIEAKKKKKSNQIIDHQQPG